MTPADGGRSLAMNGKVSCKEKRGVLSIKIRERI